MKKVRIAILGYGVIGKGVFKICLEKEEIEVIKIFDYKKNFDKQYVSLFTDNLEDIMNDNNIDIVVEVLGGYDFAKKACFLTLSKHKHLVTANKEVVANDIDRLTKMAKDNRVSFCYEASVGGAIPIIKNLKELTLVNKIHRIIGILNGTTNYILTKMSREGISYQEVLKEAQALGYAERNPEADVEGYDACRKIAILTSLAFGNTVKFEEVYTEGITKISNEDFAYAKELGSVIKLLATSYSKDGKVYAITAPFMIDSTHPLYNVNDVLNGIYVHGNVLGDVMFFGAGAGKLPTASAVVSDVVDCVKHKGKNVMTIWSSVKQELGDTFDETRRFFVRIQGDDVQAAKAAFGEGQVVKVDGINGEFGFVTEPMTERAFEDAKDKVSVISRIRIDDTKLQ